MKNKYLKNLMLLILLFLMTSCQGEKTYYEIPKSEIVDVVTEDETFKPINQSASKATEEDKGEKYYTYTNERFGYSVEVPYFLSIEERSENNDGISLKNTNGDIQLNVYGAFYFSAYYDYTSLDEIYTQELAEMTYTPISIDKGDNWYELSWEDGDMVFLKKCFLKTDESINVLLLSYPISKRSEYADIVAHIVQSFKIGIGEDSVVDK